MFEIVILSSPLPHFWPLCQSQSFLPLKIIHSVLCAKKGYLLSQCPSNLACNSLRQSIRVCQSSPLPLPLTLHTRHFLDFQQALLASVRLLTVNIQSTSHINMMQLRASSKAKYRAPHVEGGSKEEPEGIESLGDNESNTSEDKPQPLQSVEVTSAFATLSIGSGMQNNSLGEVHNSCTNPLSDEEESASDSTSTYSDEHTPDNSEGGSTSPAAQIPPYRPQGSGDFIIEDVDIRSHGSIIAFGNHAGGFRMQNTKININNSIIGLVGPGVFAGQQACSVGSATEPGIQLAGSHASQGVEHYVTVPGSPANPCDSTLSGKTSTSGGAPSAGKADGSSRTSVTESTFSVEGPKDTCGKRRRRARRRNRRGAHQGSRQGTQ